MNCWAWRTRAGVGPRDLPEVGQRAEPGLLDQEAGGVESRGRPRPTSEMATWASAGRPRRAPGSRRRRRSSSPRSRQAREELGGLVGREAAPDTSRRRATSASAATSASPRGETRANGTWRGPADPVDRRGGLGPGRSAELDQADDRPVDLDGQRAAPARRRGRRRRRGSGACRGRRSRPGRSRRRSRSRRWTRRARQASTRAVARSSTRWRKALAA